MEIILDPALKEYMKKKNKTTIIVEAVTCNNSDFEITELSVRLAGPRQATVYKEQNSYFIKQLDNFEILLPDHRTNYKDTVTFRLKSFLGIKYLSYEWISVAK